MRNFLIVLFATVILWGCADEDVIIVKNNSDQSVAYSLTTGHRTEKYTIRPGKEDSHSLVKSLSHSMKDFQSSPLQDSVDLVRSGDKYEFNNIDPVPASIYNSLSLDVILSGKGAISTDPVTINAGAEITSETILAKNPVLSAQTVNGYPVQVDISHNDEEKKYLILLK